MASIEVAWKPSSTTSYSAKHKCEECSEIVYAIREMCSSCMQVELFKCKLDLMQQQEAQKSKAEQPEEKEEQCKAREHLFNEWE